jgi:hypothetical protein
MGPARFARLTCAHALESINEGILLFADFCGFVRFVRTDEATNEVGGSDPDGSAS